MRPEISKCNELAHVVDTKTWIYNEDIRDRANQNNRRHVLFKICTFARHQRRVDGRCDRSEQQRVTVLRAPRDIVGRDHAAGAGPVFDNDRLTQQVTKFMTDDPGGNVAAGPCRKPHDQTYRARGIGFICGGRPLRDKREHGDEKDASQSDHLNSVTAVGGGSGEVERTLYVVLYDGTT